MECSKNQKNLNNKEARFIHSVLVDCFNSLLTKGYKGCVKMKLIVISDTKLFANEANIANSLFDEGLTLFHLRKYENSLSEIEPFIKEIKPEYRDRIVLHQFHEMAHEFEITRLHFSENDRKHKTDAELKQLKEKGMILSTSVHSMEDYNSLSTCFDYAFLSPVFDSISKTDYKAQPFDMASNKNKTVKLIALGGVKADNCLQVFEMGFDGVALLGSIWKSDEKIESFRKIKNKVLQIALSGAERNLRLSAASA